MQSGCSEKLAGWFVTEEAVDAMKAVAGALAKAEARNGAKRRRRRIAGADIRPLTAKQVEAVSMVNQCEGNIAEAARRMGKDRATVEQHYRAANEKLGAKIVRRGRGLPSTQALPTDGRAQADVYTDDEGAIREGRRYDGKRRKGRSADDD